MKKLPLLTILVAISVHSLMAQNPSIVWANRLGNINADFIQSVCTDASGNVYIAGSFEGTVDFDPGVGTVNLVSAGAGDAFYAKYSSSGAYIWAFRLGGSLSDEIYSITVDASQNVYVAGYFAGTVDFDPGAGVVNRTSSGGYDMFFGKYSSAGAFTWANSIGGTPDDFAFSIAVDNSGSVYITGEFSGTADFDPTAATLNKVSLGASDIFFAKYASTGNVTWVQSIGSTLNDSGRAIMTDGTNIWIGGFYSGSMDADPGAGTQPASNLGGLDGFFGQYSASAGALVWWGTIRSTGDDYISAIASDGVSLYTAGAFSGSATLFGANSTSQTKVSAGAYDIFLAKHTTASSNLVWMNSMGGTLSDACNLISLDAAGNVYLAGFFRNTVDFDPGSGTTNLTSDGELDAFFAKYTSAGALSWAFDVGSTAEDEGTSIAVDASGNVYTAGVFKNTVDVDPSSTVNLLASSGGYDGFYGKYTASTLASEPTSQPTGLTFGTVTSTTIDYTFTPASGVAGYLQVRKAGSAPTFVPTDGVAYTEDQLLSDGSVVQHADSFADGQATGLTANTTYFWRIFAYNGSGSSINYLTTNPLQGSRATLGTLASEPTAQPTNLQFTNVTSTGYDFSYTAANPAPAGYIGIRGIGEEPTTPPEDGRAYAIGDAVGNGFVNFIGTGTSWVQSNATEGTTYHLAIYSYNGTGTGINYLQTNPLRGNVTPTSDASPPVLGSNTTPSKVAQGQSVKITATWTDAESGMSNVDLAYGPTTSADWTDAAATMVNTSGNTWEFTVPASAISELGFEYRMTAYNMAGIFTETAINRVVIEHGSSGLSVPYSSFGESQSNYRIVSVPLVLDKKTVNDVFVDDLGPYDAKKWRMFRYQSGRYSEVTGTTTIDLGRGYMFIAKGSAQLDTGSGLTADTGVEKPFTLTPTNGWNLIGNPFNVDVPWVDVQAVNAGLSSVKLRVFSGGSFGDGSTLQKFSGGFIFVNTTDPITIPHIRSGRSVPPEPELELLNPIDRSNWIVDLELEMAEVKGRGGVGMTDQASEGFDKRDEFTVPRFLDFVELNHGKKLHGAHYSRDVVPFAENHEWNFDVESSDPDQVVTVRWTNAHFGVSSKQLVLWDEAQQRGIDMRLFATYSFKASESKAFRIIYGDPQFVKEKSTPWGVVFHSVSPVPANACDRITFAFSLPGAADEQPTQLEIYDIMGRRMAQLLNEPLKSGYHEVVWAMEEGRKPQQGTYISVLKVGKASIQKRLMIK